MDFRKTLFAVALTGFFVMPLIVHAQVQTTLLTAAQRAQLETELQQVEAQEAQAEQQLTQAQAQSASLSSAIAVLNAKVNAAELDIKAKNLLIQTLGSTIVDKQNHINDLESQIAAGKETLADLLRQTNELDSYSLPEVILSQTSVTGFFGDLDTFQSVEQGLQNTFDQLQADEASTSAEKDALTAQQNAQEDALYTIQQQEANVKVDKIQQQQLLSISKGNEHAYTSLVAQQEAKAAQIKAALFNLAGGSNPIPFGTALQYAQAASAVTGVDPAFLLAILTQESNLGGNVGRCYLSDVNTGAGVYVRDGSVVSNVMKPNRDVQPFLTITKALGLDPFQTIVSCQLSGIGWGGAMGPAQFIASTWSILEDRINAALNTTGMPDPWDPKQAIMAEALYLSDRGAGAGSYTAEKNAACKYYSGSACGQVIGATAYANDVMALASSIQTNQIDPLQGL